ncbi:MAG: hypothetical protein GXY48_04150 [Methanomicrobiales archaeon]|nr:hypothetical protein [Methanomicrobiales archaeon]
MNRIFLIPGFIILLLIFGAGCADEISSSIVCDGATWVSSSVLGPDSAYASSFFTTDLTSLVRSLQLDDSLKVLTSGESSGPMGIDEYAEQESGESGDSSGCLFSLPGNESVRKSEILTSGLLSGGKFVSSRDIADALLAEYVVNGSGLFLTRAVSDDGNRTMKFGSDVSGVMNVTERMVLGDVS